MKMTDKKYAEVQAGEYGIKMFAELQRQAYAIRDNEAARQIFTERFNWNKEFVEGMTGTKISLKNWELVVEEQ